MKSFYKLLLFSILCIAAGSSVFAAPLYVDGKLFEVETKTINNVTYRKASDLKDALGYECFYDSNTKKITLTKKGLPNLILTLNSQAAAIGVKNILVPYPPVLVDNELYIDLAPIALRFGDTSKTRNKILYIDTYYARMEAELARAEKMYEELGKEEYLRINAIEQAIKPGNLPIISEDPSLTLFPRSSDGSFLVDERPETNIDLSEEALTPTGTYKQFKDFKVPLLKGSIVKKNYKYDKWTIIEEVIQPYGLIISHISTGKKNEGTFIFISITDNAEFDLALENALKILSPKVSSKNLEKLSWQMKAAKSTANLSGIIDITSVQENGYTIDTAKYFQTGRPDGERLFGTFEIYKTSK